jgi:hypothetical protein
MHYEINISKNGQHLFATAERSAQSPFALKRILEDILPKFPKEEGYEIRVTEWNNVKTVSIEEDGRWRRMEGTERLPGRPLPQHGNGLLLYT